VSACKLSRLCLDLLLAILLPLKSFLPGTVSRKGDFEKAVVVLAALYGSWRLVYFPYVCQTALIGE